MPKGVNKGVRSLAKEAGVSPALVTRKLNQGKGRKRIIAEAAARRGEAATCKPKRGKESFAEAQARKESHLANLREIEEREKLGELVESDLIEARWSELGTKIVNAVLGIGSRVANQVPAEWRHQIVTVVDTECRRVLTTLSDDIATAGKAL